MAARRTDLVADRTRAINRLRAQLLEYFPALERAFDYSSSRAARTLLTGYQTPDGIRRAGAARLAGWLRKRKARNASAVAAAALEAAQAQHTTVPGQQIAAAMAAAATAIPASPGRGRPLIADHPRGGLHPVSGSHTVLLLRNLCTV